MNNICPIKCVLIISKHRENQQRKFCLHGLTLVPTWISNHLISKMWDELTYQFPNLNSCTEIEKLHPASHDGGNYLFILGLHYCTKGGPWVRVTIKQTNISRTWWRHQMEIFSALLALCAGNSPVTGEFPSQRPVTRSFDVFFDLRLNKRSKQSRCRDNCWDNSLVHICNNPYSTKHTRQKIRYTPCVKRKRLSITCWNIWSNFDTLKLKTHLKGIQHVLP